LEESKTTTNGNPGSGKPQEGGSVPQHVTE
jgi:hypothetical protein